jgi:hypothetical protein
MQQWFPEFLEVAQASWVECPKISTYTSAEFFILSCRSYYVFATKKKCYDYYKDGFVLTHDQINLLIIGNVIAFYSGAFSH